MADIIEVTSPSDFKAKLYIARDTHQGSPARPTSHKFGGQMLGCHGAEAGLLRKTCRLLAHRLAKCYHILAQAAKHEVRAIDSPGWHNSRIEVHRLVAVAILPLVAEHKLAGLHQGFTGGSKRFGARVMRTHRLEFMQGAINKAKEILAEHPDYFMPQQFENPANPEIHRKTTAQEILQVVGTNLDALVVGIGTGGTATGTGEVIKQQIKHMKLFAVEPSDSPVLSGGKAGWHKIQGIGAGFIPEVLNRDVIDRILAIDYEDASSAAHRLAEQEGILCGISSGAILHASCIVAQELGRGTRLLAILPDTGERYLSTEWFS